MMIKTTVVLLVYIAVQVQSITKEEVKEIRKECKTRYPISLKEGQDNEAYFDFCLLNATGVMNDEGEVDKSQLVNLLKTQYRKQELIEQVVDICIIKQITRQETAFFITKACWFDPSKSLQDIKYIVNIWECIIPLSYSKTGKDQVGEGPVSEQETSKMTREAVKCLFGKTDIVDEKGGLNTAALKDVLRVSGNEDEFVEFMLGCAKEKDSRQSTLDSLNTCYLTYEENEHLRRK